MTSMNIYPYVYRLDNPSTGEFYIGYRAANKVPAELDLGVKYFTSSKIVKPRFLEFTHTILAEFFTKEAAYDFEQELILLHRQIPGLLNKHCCKDGSLRWMTHENTYKGKSRGPMKEETKKKIGDKNRGRVISEETKKKLSKTSTGRVITWSENSKKNQSITRTSSSHLLQISIKNLPDPQIGKLNGMHKSNRDYNSESERIRAENISTALSKRTHEQNLNSYKRIKSPEELAKISAAVTRECYCIHCHLKVSISNLKRHVESKHL